MKLSVSNLGWEIEYNDKAYKMLKAFGIGGIEIAPTKIFGIEAYDRGIFAKEYFDNVKEVFNLEVSSMQSLWYGRNEVIFSDTEQRKRLLEYTKSAIDFAVMINCDNLVFGSPKSRIMKDKSDILIAKDFFAEIGDYSFKKKVHFALEANPAVYGTNFLNNTKEALKFVSDIKSEGLSVNLDFGTVIINGEDVKFSDDELRLISHIHISEPHLAPLVKRKEHLALRDILRSFNYDRYVSLEMSIPHDFEDLIKSSKYLSEVFGNGI
ncbi:MAG: sugar phosphate isomerase/epimerase [Ruminococcaceae bacterium]|nr:sugar phosphate isomerase/epimerase [Oscillospiraceae bacterium]